MEKVSIDLSVSRQRHTQMELLHVVSELVNSAVRHGRRPWSEDAVRRPTEQKKPKDHVIWSHWACVERLHGPGHDLGACMRHERVGLGGMRGARQDRRAVHCLCALSAIQRKPRLCLAYRPMCLWRG